jgi:site-specific recombinase XerD
MQKNSRHVSGDAPAKISSFGKEQSQFPAPIRPRKLLDHVRDVLRVNHYSLRTEEAYLGWIRRFILFNGKKHPGEMGASEVEIYLTHLAVDEKVSTSTQKQALNALAFLYHKVMQKPLGQFAHIARPKKPQRRPLVLSKEEVERILRVMTGTHQLMATLLFGTGMRLLECLRLRVKDVDFALNQIEVRDGKGWKDRVTMLPERVKPALEAHLQRVREIHRRDIGAGGPKRWSESFPARIGNGRGNMFFRL